jgi:CobQ-like glutamine amidotransferase family enzyme
MITYHSFEPIYFNNNGDQGNLEVLLHYLAASSFEVERVDNPERADFLLIGDASQAVIDHFGKQLNLLRQHLQERYQAGRPTLLVGSVYEYFSIDLGLIAQKSARETGFVSTADGYFGYRNSDNNLPDVLTQKSFIATKLFGPVLAKNPKLLELVLGALGAELAMSDAVASWISTIRRKSAARQRSGHAR